MTRGKRSWVFQVTWLCMLALVTLAGVLLVGAPAKAEDSGLPVYQLTEYPIDDFTEEPFFDPGYPVETTEPFPVETQQPGQPVLSPTAGFTATFTATVPPDVFATENAEMNSAQVTPPGTATPAPSLTPYMTATPQQSLTAAFMPADADAKNGPFQVDWGLFWIGFSIPVLAACGVVLYLLDRRPNLFRSAR